MKWSLCLVCSLVSLSIQAAVLYPQQPGSGGGGGTGSSNITDSAYTAVIRNAEVKTNLTVDANGGTFSSFAGSNYIGTNVVIGGTQGSTLWDDNFQTNGIIVSTTSGFDFIASNNLGAFKVKAGIISAKGVTNTSFAAIGVVTNDANGNEYTTPTLPSTLVGSGQAVYGGSSGPITVPISGTFFFSPNNTFTNNATDTAGVTRCVIPANGTLANLYVVASANPGAVANTIKIFTNGVATSIVVTANNVTSGNDTTHLVAVLAGEEVGVQIVTGAGTAVRWDWGFQLR